MTLAPGISERAARGTAAIGAGLAAALVIALFVVRLPPLPLLRLVGVDSGLDLFGGGVMTYLPPGDADKGEVERRLAAWIDRRGGTIGPGDGGGYELALPGVSAREVPALAELLTLPGLQFQVVDADAPIMRRAFERANSDRRATELGVHAEIDGWMDEDGRQHNDYYLWADDRAVLEAYVAESLGSPLAGAPDREILLERVERDGPTAGHTGPYWRSYLVDRAVPLDGSSVASVTKAYDPQTGRVVILLDFDRDGGERFGELTARIVGQKLATVLGGVIKSAPIINSPIRGGRASIAMGGSDPQRQEADADDLLVVLRGGPLPAGGHIVDAHHVAPTVSPATLWLLRAGLGVIAGAIAFGLILFAARRASPTAHPGGRATRRPPWRALAVTLAAPIALYFSTALVLPGVNRDELAGLPATDAFGPFALGLAPLVIAFILVELLAAAVPRWRVARLTPAGRRVLGRVVVVVAIGLALAQAIWVARTLGTLDTPRGMSPLAATTRGSRALIVLSLIAGTLILGLVAGVVSEYGLGNGFSVLIGSGLVIEADRWISTHPHPGLGTAEIALIVIAAVCVVAVVGWVVAHRVADDPRAKGERAAPIPMPVAGLLPLWWVGATTTVLTLAYSLGIDVPRWTFSELDAVTASPVTRGALAVVLTVGLGWLLVRPGAQARITARMTGAAIAPPTRAWVMATGASVMAVLVVYLLGFLIEGVLPHVPAFSVIPIATITVVVLDVVDDWRARRRADLVGVWPIHQVGMAEVAAGQLARAGITTHLRNRRHRSLLHVFGPFVPIEVMVPADRASEAKAIMRDVFDPASRGVVSAW